MDHDGGKFDVTKLNGSNYGAWKFKMHLLLVHKELWDVVLGTDDEINKSLKALALIGLSVSDSQIVHLQGCETGQQAWQKLADLYENKGVANKMHLMEELLLARMNDEDQVQNHIERLRRVVGQLGTVGSPIDDEQYKMSLLRSLPKSYESLVVTLENLVEHLSVEDLHARILREEARRKRDGEDISDSKLLSARDIVCHHCNKKGHKKSQCWALRRKRSQGKHKKGTYPKQQRHGNEHAFMTSSSSDSPSEYWYIDSGASFHATSNKNFFVDGSLQETNPRQIELADGSKIEASKEGTVKGVITTSSRDYEITLKKVLYVPDMHVSLISVSCIEENGYYVRFRNNSIDIIRDEDGACALKASRIGRSYKVKMSKEHVVQ